MKVVGSVVVAGVLVVVVVLCGALVVRGEASSAGAELKRNPVTRQVERQDVFEFTQKPRVTKVGDKYVISFASKGKCDATVAVVAPDGKVVRHLASGVLGENAPWPFKRDTLTQVIEWDGKTDAGKLAPAGCKVRVSLGLKPVFDKVFGWYGGVQEDIAGMAVDSQGQLYVLGSPNSRVEDPSHVRVFDRQGRYLRTIMPHQATVPPERMTLIEWTETTWGEPAIYRPRSGGSRVFDRYRWPGSKRAVGGQSPVVTPDGRFVFITNYLAPGWGMENPGRKVILLDARDGAAPPGSIVDADRGVQREAGVLGDGRIFMAVSPDGKWLYLGGAESRKSLYSGRGESSHAISRISLVNPGMARRFIGEYDKPGSDNAHFNQPRGVACDKNGNLYVADYGNDRIQVFKPDGAHLWTLPLQKPAQLAVHPRTGEIYVLCALPIGENFDMRLVKLGGRGLDDPKVRARFDLPLSQRRITQTMALDASSDPPAVWVAADRLWRLEDQGDRFAKVLNVQERNQPQEGWENWKGGRQQPYITADPFREELYVREQGGIVYGSAVLRVDGRTGKVIERLTQPIENVCMGPDGSVYLRFMHYPGHKWLGCYDPDAHKYVAFPQGVVPPGVDFPLGPGYHTAKGEWRSAPTASTLRLKEDFPLGPYLPHGGAGRSYADHTEVAPNGDIYVLHGPSPEHLRELEKAGLPRPTGKAIETSRLLQVYSPEGELKALSILPGLWAGPCGLEVRVGPSGAVYLAGMYHPAGQNVPEGIAPDQILEDVLAQTPKTMDELTNVSR